MFGWNIDPAAAGPAGPAPAPLQYYKCYYTSAQEKNDSYSQFHYLCAIKPLKRCNRNLSKAS